MSNATGQAFAGDNGWTFLKIDDPVRGFIKPLEYVSSAWLARQLPKTVGISDIRDSSVPDERFESA